MADTSMDTETDIQDGDGGDGERRRKFSGKKVFLFVVLPIVLIGAVWQMGLADSLMGGEKVEEPATHGEKQAKKATHAVYYDMPDLLVNLNTSNGQPRYLKLAISLELHDEKIEKELEKVLPRIVDRFQVYLRELRAEDISGSAGVYRLKEELLSRVNTAVEPHEVSDVLFREMLVQ